MNDDDRIAELENHVAVMRAEMHELARRLRHFNVLPYETSQGEVLRTIADALDAMARMP